MPVAAMRLVTGQVAMGVVGITKFEVLLTKAKRDGIGGSNSCQHMCLWK
jgi:hypothetical protein